MLTAVSLLPPTLILHTHTHSHTPQSLMHLGIHDLACAERLANDSCVKSLQHQSGQLRFDLAVSICVCVCICLRLCIHEGI